MAQYVCNPIKVDAFRITHVSEGLFSHDDGGFVITLDGGEVVNIDPAKASRMTPQIGDYLVRTHKPDEYEYLNPKHVFEAKYGLVNTSSPSQNFSFGAAIEALKDGRKVARAGWNGKGMYLYYVPANSYPAQTAIAKNHGWLGDMVPYGAYIAMKTAQNNVVPWLASQTDVLADDWQIAE